jgi:hypothetical protein
VLALWMSLALAAPRPLVVVGDGLVVGSHAPSTEGEPSSGWVAGLGDCLGERAPGRYSVVDRVRPTETVRSVLGIVDAVLAPEPALIVMGLGAQEANASADLAEFEASLTALSARLGADGRGLVLVGVVPSSEAAPGEGDARITRWNEAISRVASASSARHVDLWAAWPREPSARASLTASTHGLTDQGHARVAAAVCDAVLSWKDATEETP